MATPGRTAAIVFVTDGVPTGCSANTIAAAADVAATAYMTSPSIQTFVVGLGDTAALDQIAVAGSGGMQHYIPAQGDVARALTDALKMVARMITCRYAIPMTPGRPVDPNNVNVEVTIGTNAPVRVGKVVDLASCASQGWYYDNAANPTAILLCPDTCSQLKANPNSSVEVLFGCPSSRADDAGQDAPAADGAEGG